MKNRIMNLIFLFSLHIPLTAFTILMISIIGFLINISINPSIIPISLVVSSTLLFFLTKKFRKKQNISTKNTIILFLIVLLFYIVATLFVAHFYDVSADGQHYHQEAIIAMKQKHWNPLRSYNVPQGLHRIAKTWVQHYAKGSEIVSSAIYSFTQRIETAKVFNILFIFSSLLLAAYVFINEFKFKVTESILIAYALALNPVAIYQHLSFYIDGQIYSLIVTSIFLMIMYIRKKDNLYLIMFSIIICLLINLKFTAILFAVVLCFALLFFMFFMKVFNCKKTILIGTILLLVGIVSIFLVGFNPYSYNTLKHKHPFYPLAGDSAINFMPENTPNEYKPLNKIEKILASSFILKTDGSKIIPRIPFNLTEWNFTFMQFTDIRVQGFGVFFMEISLLALLLYFYILFNKDYTNKHKVYLVSSASIILLSCLIIPESWWARYVPQMYILTILPVVFTFIFNKQNFLSKLVLFFLILNSIYTVVAYVNAAHYNANSINQSIMKLKEENRDIIILENGAFYNNRIRLEENQIEYKVVDLQKWQEIDKPTEIIFCESLFEVKYDD